MVEYNREVLIETMVYHWPTNTSGCHCGWAELGKSFPGHVADVYEMSMAAREEEPEDVVDYIKKKIKEALDEKYAKLPWWCMQCGEGGNYEGERPTEFWFPPADHVCRDKTREERDGEGKA